MNREDFEAEWRGRGFKVVRDDAGAYLAPVVEAAWRESQYSGDVKPLKAIKVKAGPVLDAQIDVGVFDGT